jgi:hypothetical protein
MQFRRYLGTLRYNPQLPCINPIRMSLNAYFRLTDYPARNNTTLSLLWGSNLQTLLCANCGPRVPLTCPQTTLETRPTNIISPFKVPVIWRVPIFPRSPTYAQFEVYGPYCTVDILKWALLFDWYMLRLVVSNEHHKDGLRDSWCIHRELWKLNASYCNMWMDVFRV